MKLIIAAGFAAAALQGIRQLGWVWIESRMIDPTALHEW
jgi:hypothetical protein